MTVINGTSGNDVLDMAGTGTGGYLSDVDYVYGFDGDDVILINQNYPARNNGSGEQHTGRFDYIYGGNGEDTLVMTIRYTDLTNMLSIGVDPTGGYSGTYSWNSSWTSNSPPYSGIHASAGFYFYNFEHFDITIEHDNYSLTLAGGNDVVHANGDVYVDMGAGNDTLYFHQESAFNTTMTISGSLATGYSGNSYNYGAASQNVDFAGVEHFNAIFGTGNDSATFGDGNDTVFSDAGHDVINVAGGINVVDGGTGSDQLGIDLTVQDEGITLDLRLTGEQQSGGDGSVQGFESFGIVVGSAFDDWLYETDTTINTNGTFDLGAGDDYLRVSRGQDVVEGGAGSDCLAIDHSGSGFGSYYLTAFAGDFANGYSGELYNYAFGRVNFSDIQHFDLIGGNAADVLTSGDGDDNLIGNSGNDVLSVGRGNNSADGGAGSDRLSADFSDQLAGVTLDLTQAGEQLLAGVGSVTGIESFGIITGSAFDDSFIDTGSTINANSTISTGAGNDYVRTIYGNDSIAMGSGSDRLAIDHSGSAFGSYFSVALSGSFAAGYAGSIYNYARGTTAFTGVEHFDLTGGSAADTFTTGSGDDNILTGTGADDVLAGAGNDYVAMAGNGSFANGGTGVDTIDLSGRDGGGGAHTINGRTGMWQSATQRMTLLNFENVIAMNNSHDTITGSSLANMLSGLSGDDTLNGSGGNDVLLGGEGNDFLNGGTGADAMSGGSGNDIYYVDSVGDSVTELPGEGLDEVRAAIDYTLGDNLENLRLQGGARIGTGNALDNVILAGGGPATLNGMDGNDALTGSAASDTLNGGTGDDVIYGRNGNDAIDGGDGNDILRGEVGSDSINGGAGDDSGFGGDGQDVMHGGDGNDILRGEAQNDTLYGEAGDDTLQGGDGNDNIYGGAGRDVMSGGLGIDNFWFDEGDFAGLTNGTADRIQDFVQGQDRIRLTDIDANALVAGDQAFVFIGGAAFSNTAGELRYTQSGGVTLVEGDVDGDGAADFAIALTGTIALLGSDFTL